MYFICDVYDRGVYGEVMNEKQLKDRLVREIANDIENNIQEQNIVLACVNILTNIATNKCNLKYIIENLESYGWKIIDLLQIQRDLEDLKDYFASDDSSSLAIDFKNIMNRISEEFK